MSDTRFYINTYYLTPEESHERTREKLRGELKKIDTEEQFEKAGILKYTKEELGRFGSHETKEIIL